MPGPREDGRREIFEKIVFLASGESVQVSIAEFGVNPKTEIDFAYDPHRKGEERKSRFSNGISFLTP
ncbi:hypothetical protein ABH19_10705 [Leptospirillum sp. Group II 'CF-1']|jgi:hypothetical protein|nr:hypothetical protein ABH19_10705 [Leptospirillum sp. Group II 'CF-1']